jgi:nucleotide-binding universal stress UspA family protein
VVRVPPQLTLGEGRLFLKEGRAYLDQVIQQAKQRGVPVHTIIRLGRNVSESIRKTVYENASDMIVFGWPGFTQTNERLFGSVIDPILDDPPTDVAVVRYRQRRPIRKVLVPVSGGPNSRRAVKMAASMASMSEEGPAQLTLLHVLPPGAEEQDRIRARQVIDYSLEGVNYDKFDIKLVEGEDIVETVLRESEGYDLIVVGATEEPLFKNLLAGRMPEKIARLAKVSVVMVKRRSGRLHSIIRQTVLDPTIPQPLESDPPARR